MRRLFSTLFLVSFLVLTACGPKPTEDVISDATPPGGKRPTPIPPPPPGQGFSDMAGRIYKRPKWYEGQTVTLVGYFRGLDLLDEVILDAPENRVNDWVITDDSGGIWVAFRGKLPFPPTSHEVWRIVRVQGTVQVHKNGMAYILPDSVQWEGLTDNFAVLPALALVAVHRFGGPDNLNHHTYWYSTGGLAVIDVAADWKGSMRLKRGQILDLEKAFKKAKFFDLPSQLGSPCDGCVRYDVAAVNEKANEPHFVTAYEGSVPKELQSLIDLMAEISTEAEPVP